MSIRTIHSSIERIEREIADLEKRAADEAKKEARKSGEIGRIERSITKNTSISSYNSKKKQIERLTNDAAKAREKKAGYDKKTADKRKQLHRHKQDLSREEDRERKKQQRLDRQLQTEREFQLATLDTNLSAFRPLPQRNIADESNKTGSVIEYDAFISHATEDKEEFVEPLANELTRLGLHIWYDVFKLSVGDSLRQSIDHGLSKSRYGIVVLSSAFFSKQWPQYELNGLVAREMDGVKVILPIWHKVSFDEVRSFSPPLADKVALNSSLLRVTEIAEKLANVLRDDET